MPYGNSRTDIRELELLLLKEEDNPYFEFPFSHLQNTLSIEDMFKYAIGADSFISVSIHKQIEKLDIPNEFESLYFLGEIYSDYEIREERFTWLKYKQASEVVSDSEDEILYNALKSIYRR